VMTFLDVIHCQFLLSVLKMEHPSRSLHGRAPSSGKIKINWDASLNNSLGCIGFGCVAQDWIGKFLGPKCTFKWIMVEPKIAKAMSALHVVQFGLAAGYSDVIFEGDALLVIQDVNMASPHFNTTGHFVESIQQVQGFFSSSYLFTATGRLMAWHIF
jgi:hypothetical protein